MYIITLQDRSTYYMSIRVILISTQQVLATQVLAYGMLCSLKFEVNVSISKIKVSFKIYLQEHSLQLKYTK